MYDIEVKTASKNGWHTPDEARRYYGRYARDGITVHWWGDGTGASNHDNIVNYFLRQGQLGNKSVNYVLSDIKITNMVHPDNVSWTSQKGNPTSISVETQPTLGAEGYKKWGWLVWQLEQRYGKRLNLYPHSYWFPTACPGSISLDRIRQEADKWARGHYNAPPPPAPPKPIDIVWEQLPVTSYTTNKEPTNLWQFNAKAWPEIKPLKPFAKNEPVRIYGKATNTALKASYLVTEYSFTRKLPYGFNAADLDVVPRPPELPKPTNPPATQPEWVQNLRDIDHTDYWVRKDQALIDITTGNPYKGPDGKTPVFEKNDEYDASALTIANNVEYRITEYSFSKGRFLGLPIGSLTLTPPGVPDVPPVQEDPDLEERVTAVEGFLDKLKRFFPFIK